jgi:hypothetical protein
MEKNLAACCSFSCFSPSSDPLPSLLVVQKALEIPKRNLHFFKMKVSKKKETEYKIY